MIDGTDRPGPIWPWVVMACASLATVVVHDVLERQRLAATRALVDRLEVLHLERLFGE